MVLGLRSGDRQGQGCRDYARDRLCRDSLRGSLAHGSGLSGAARRSHTGLGTQLSFLIPEPNLRDWFSFWVMASSHSPPPPGFASNTRSRFSESPEQAREGSVDPHFHLLHPNPAKKWTYLWEMDENTEMSPRTGSLQYFFSIYKRGRDLPSDVPANELHAENSTTHVIPLCFTF